MSQLFMRKALGLGKEEGGKPARHTVLFSEPSSYYSWLSKDWEVCENITLEWLILCLFSPW